MVAKRAEAKSEAAGEKHKHENDGVTLRRERMGDVASYLTGRQMLAVLSPGCP